MKKSIFALSLGLACVTAVADEYVRGYTKKDGTYVAPHYRTSPNSRQNDNYSYQGNQNPYTGEKGYTKDDNNPSSYNQDRRRRNPWR